MCLHQDESQVPGGALRVMSAPHAPTPATARSCNGDALPLSMPLLLRSPCRQHVPLREIVRAVCDRRVNPAHGWLLSPRDAEAIWSG